MAIMRSALTKAVRAIQAEMALAESLAPLKEALGEALDVEKYLDEQRALKEAIATEMAAVAAERDAVRESLAAVKGEAATIVADARAAALGIAKDAKADADRITDVARKASTDALKVLDDAHAKASAIVGDAVAEANGKRAEIAALTKELADLDAKVKTARQAAMRIREALS